MAELKRYRSIVADSARWHGFEFRDGDIVITTPPKCGTTWMQTLVSLLVFDTVELDRPLSTISLWLDMQLATLAEVRSTLEQQTHRRFIKSHTPLDGIPYDPRVTYIGVGRDPRDVAVSTAHHMSNMDVALFMAKREAAVGLDDVAEIGHSGPGPGDDQPSALQSWMESDGSNTPMSLAFLVDHLEQLWRRREEPGFVLFHYDDLLADLPAELRRLADALGIERSDERLRELAAAASFASMKARAEQTAPNADIKLWRDSSEFFHRGSSGQWREVFSPEDLRRYDERLRELAPPDLVAWLHHEVPVS